MLVEGTALTFDFDASFPSIPELTERLKDVMERRSHADQKDRPYDGHLVVQCDRATDYALVRQAIGSINAAGWTRIELAVTSVADGEAL